MQPPDSGRFHRDRRHHHSRRGDEGSAQNRNGYFRAYPGSGTREGGSADWRDGDDRDEGIGSLLGDAYGLFALALAALCGVGMITILLLLYVSVRPFSRPTYRRLSANLGAAAFLDAAALLLPNTRLCLTGDSDVPSPVGASVLVCNHLVEGDWWSILMLGRCVGLRGSVKVFLRNEVLQGRGDAKFASQSLSRSVPDLAAASCGPLPSAASAPSLRHDSAGCGAAAGPSHTAGGGSGGSGSGGDRAAANGGSPSVGGGGGGDDGGEIRDAPPHIRLGGYLLRTLLEFPLLSSENNKNWVQDRGGLFALLRSFAEGGAPAPVQLLLFPEGWSLEGDGTNRRSVMAKSVEFARREGRPQLRHLLLPRTTGFNASLESLRESSPVVYDVTMAYRGYDGTVPISAEPSWPTLWRLVRGRLPPEVHFRIKRYSMEEVLSDAQWLDQRWAEKDRLLGHFVRHQDFPLDPRGFCRHRVFNTRTHGIEGSLVGLAWLGAVPFMIPIILLVSIPLCWMVLWLWLAHRAFCLVFPDWEGISTLGDGLGSAGARQTPGSAGGVDSLGGTPFFPATPFASPTHVTSWRSSSEPHQDHKEGDSSTRR